MTTHSPRRFATTADRLAGIDDPSMGDERERDIALRAGTAAMVGSIFAILLLGVLFAAIGAGMWSAVLFLAAIVPSGIYNWYCRSSGIDTARSYAKIAPRRRNLAMTAGFAAAGAWVAALAFHMITGAPLIDVGLGAEIPDGSSTAYGLITGGLMGTAVGVLVLTGTVRIGRKRLTADDDADDED